MIMGCLSRGLASVLILTMAISCLSLLTAKSVSAQSIPKPSVPEFTVSPAGPSFDIPPTYSFNSSTGLFDANDGYHIQYSTVKITIKNQPFTNQTSIDSLYYNVRIKPHGYPDSYWLELFSAGADGYPIQAQGNFTIIPVPVEGAEPEGNTIPTGATTDIQVEVMIGHIGRNSTYPYSYVFLGEVSGWSSTQTVTLPPKTPFAVPTSPTPAVPELSWLAIVPLFLSVFSVAVIVRHRKNR